MTTTTITTETIELRRHVKVAQTSHRPEASFWSIVSFRAAVRVLKSEVLWNERLQPAVC